MKKRKLLSILAILMMAVPHSYAKVYESNLNYYDDELSNGESATIDGIVIRVNSGTIDFDRDWQGYGGANSFTISTALGETITGIEITCDVEGINGTGWTEKTPGVVWSGSSTSVNVGGYLRNVTHIKVTVADATVNVTANEGATGEYWATYYNATQGYTADENTTVYKAALNGTSSVTLTEVAGREIPAGQAVILKSTTGTITLTPTATTSSDFTGNDLKGGTTVTSGNVAYTLSRGNAGTGAVGFYKFSGSLDGSKAHLEISTSAGTRSFIGFGDDNTTGIELPALADDEAAEWYSLDGRRLSGKPARKGIYVKDGQKYIIK